MTSLYRSFVLAVGRRRTGVLNYGAAPSPFKKTLDGACHDFRSYSRTAYSHQEQVATKPKAKGQTDDLLEKNGVRLSKFISAYSKNMTMSRKEAERLIVTGNVTYAGERITVPHMMVDLDKVYNGLVQVNGKPLLLQESDANNSAGKTTACTRKTRVWLVHKIIGELVSDGDPHNRPSLIDRLSRGGIGKSKKNGTRDYLKPVGRLDLSSEGLVVVTNDGEYARQLELPKNRFHRTYRVKVHGVMNAFKVARMNRGLTVDGISYKGMRVVEEERKGRRHVLGTNKWIKITCIEGKNRIIRKAMKHLGLTVTRLIRTKYGDYDLESIPPGGAQEVIPIPVEKHKSRGFLFRKHKETSKAEEESEPPAIQWVRYHS